MLKKALALLIGALICSLAFCGCEQSNKTISPAALTEEMKECTPTDIVWTAVSPDNVISYLGFDGRIASDSAVFIDDAEDEFNIVAVFTFDSNEKLTAATEAINSALTNAAQSYKTISADQSDKITNRTILYKGNSLALAASENSADIAELLEKKGWNTPAPKAK